MGDAGEDVRAIFYLDPTFFYGSNTQVNEDLAFPHYLHMVDHTKVVQINII